MLAELQSPLRENLWCLRHIAAPLSGDGENLTALGSFLSAGENVLYARA
jgi:hypothetical protein